MAQPEKPTVHQASLRGYIIGLVLSLFLTLTAFLFVNEHVSAQHNQFPHEMLIPLLGVFALAQFVVQMVFFLHLGTESKPRWKSLAFWFMIMIVLIIVVGSIWIMQNLNYNMMGPQETTQYMKDHQGF